MKEVKEFYTVEEMNEYHKKKKKKDYIYYLGKRIDKINKRIYIEGELSIFDDFLLDAFLRLTELMEQEKIQQVTQITDYQMGVNK